LKKREEALRSLADPFDVLVIGGGATGLGIAVDAATRGFRTALAEAGDFAQATSSRSTKLVHGGVRYLASGDVALVREALRERATLLRNAPHLVRPQAFVIPAYRQIDLPFYGAGLLLYDLLSGRSTMGPTRILRRAAVQEQIPNIEDHQLRGGVLYHDGQFNDARLALALARTADDHGATVLNYLRCARLIEQNGKLTAAVLLDGESGAEHVVRARAIFNATGIFSDTLRQMDAAGTPPLLSVSRGTHIVLPNDVLGGQTAIMVPKTSDGRVIFAIPWQQRVLVGTTDVPAPEPLMEPGHTEAEIDFLIDTLNSFLARKVGRGDILCVFSGLRPLVSGKAATTSKLSREHLVEIAASGLITVAGGKWTTYRRMAEDALNATQEHGFLAERDCVTADIPLHGAGPFQRTNDLFLNEYGTDLPALDAIAASGIQRGERIDPEVPCSAAQVIFAAREEGARTIEDVLARRTRCLLLDANAALRAAPRVAEILQRELGHDHAWASEQLSAFSQLVAENYVH
jgi:glycerol-3-phosphate dehydrogenase